MRQEPSPLYKTELLEDGACAYLELARLETFSCQLKLGHPTLWIAVR
jgi:hypothetical protein